MLDEKWETKPHNCHIDNNTGKPLPFTPPCTSLIIPGVIYEPMNKDLAERIVSDHNTMLAIHQSIIKETESKGTKPKDVLGWLRSSGFRLVIDEEARKRAESEREE